MKGIEYIVIGVCLVVLVASIYRMDGFQNRAGSNMPSASQITPDYPHILSQSDSGRVIMEKVNDPYAAKAIRSIDDYDYTVVEDNEGDRELSMALRNKLMSQRPMEWSGMPPSSTQFQAGLRESFANASQTVPDDAKPYEGLNGGGAMAPPDTNASEMRERATLQTYVPKRISKELTYDIRDADDLIRKVYDEKGLIPTVAHEKGTNVYEIVGVRRKDEKIVYEGEEAPASVGPVQKAGEATIHVPSAAADMAASKDPYYDTTPGASKTRMGKWDFQAWTPGLERMFAPTEPKQDWY